MFGFSLKLFSALALAGCVAIGSILLWMQFIYGSCIENIVNEVDSPDHRLVARLTERQCKDGTATRLLVFSKVTGEVSAEQTPQSSLAFVVDGKHELRLEWRDAMKLEVGYPQKAFVHHLQREIGLVKIVYKVF